jgi:hypothetical protein
MARGRCSFSIPDASIPGVLHDAGHLVEQRPALRHERRDTEDTPTTNRTRMMLT